MNNSVIQDEQPLIKEKVKRQKRFYYGKNDRFRLSYKARRDLLILPRSIKQSAKFFKRSGYHQFVLRQINRKERHFVKQALRKMNIEQSKIHFKLPYVD